MSNRPLFYLVKKSKSYLSWRPYEGFMDFGSVCVDVISDREFVLYQGGCIEVQKLGRKYYVPLPPKALREGYYELVEEKDGKYRFILQEQG